MRNVIVAGASSGLGFSVSRLLLEARVPVVGISRRVPSLKVDHLMADLSNSGDVDRTVEAIKASYSEFSAVILSVGSLEIQRFTDITRESIEAQFATNVFPVIQIVSGLREQIEKNCADIVIVGSTSAFKAVEGHLVYSSSKWALRGVIEGFRAEFSSTGCRVIGFHPGGFESDLYSRATGCSLPNSETWMSPDDLAKLIVALLNLPKVMEVSNILINRNHF